MTLQSQEDADPQCLANKNENVRAEPGAGHGAEERGGDVRFFRENREAVLSIGMLCVVGAVVLKRFGGGVPYVAFIEGMLLGISVVFNVAYLARRPRGRE